MAARTKLPSDPSFLLEYMQDMPSESDSDDDFEGYLGPEDGPVAYRTAADIAMVEREDACTPIRRSRSVDSLTAEESALPESPLSPSQSPMQGHHSSGSPLASVSSPSLIPREQSSLSSPVSLY